MATMFLSIVLFVVSLCNLINFISISKRLEYLDNQIYNLYKHIDEINSRIDKATDTYIAGRDIEGHYHIEKYIREEDVRND